MFNLCTRTIVYRKEKIRFNLHRSNIDSARRNSRTTKVQPRDIPGWTFELRAPSSMELRLPVDRDRTDTIAMRKGRISDGREHGLEIKGVRRRTS